LPQGELTMTQMQNSFIWYDLMTTDMEAAKRFYSDVLGWSIHDSAMPGMDYAVITTDGCDMGGIMPVPPNAPGGRPMWIGYIYSADVDADAKRAVKLGGSIHQEAMDIPGVGRFAVIADPAGATFILFTPLPVEAPARGGSSAMGAVGWNELHAGDLDTAWTFYSQMFGWAKGTVMPMGAMGDYVLFQIDGKDVGGMMKKQDMPPMPMWLYYFNVDGIDAAVARITKGGGKIAMGPHQVPGGQWIVMALDPQGGSFQLLSATK
jgi:uncharacterized protein